ncbi:MAG: ABC transporter ATP-binding protein [Spirochaetaceae bacterium]|nr:ABC transporter ATP-binding protein [Spirochaetaceae bacterium]
MSYVQLKNIDAGYVKGKPILREFNLSVEKGELLSLLGPSGCGKTTTLRTIAGFIMAEKGHVLINGKDYSRIPPNKRNIGLVFQNYALFPHLSVFDNIAYGLKRRKVEKSLIRKKVDSVIEMVSLEDLGNRLPAQLSGGQRQRVALARSIVIEPDLLLLDEPLSNLDAKLRDEMRAELSRLQHQLGITMIYVTHDQVEALSLSSRIIIMNEGYIEQMGTPEEIYDSPETPFVARFMGFDNSLKGTVTGIDGDALTVDVGGTPFSCKASRSKSVGIGDPVNLFFRPEDALMGSGGEANSLAAEVNFYNFQGGTTLCSVTAAGSQIQVLLPGKNVIGQESSHVLVPVDKIIVEKV